MTNAEKIIVRWLGALAAGLSGIAGVAGVGEVISQDVMIIILLVTAFITSVLTAVTTEAVQTKIGLQQPRGVKRGK